MARTIDIGTLAQGIAARGTVLPFDDYSDAVKLVICNALRTAWTMLCAEAVEDKKDVNTLDEDSITVLYKEILNRIRTSNPPLVPGFTHLTFETVVRDATVVSFDGKHVEKKPDLVFRTLSTSPAEPCHEYRGIFVECKIVSNKHSIDDYADKGMLRFISGQYSWAMRSGVMVCYSRDAQSLTNCLVPAMRSRQKLKGDALYKNVLPKKVSALGSTPPAYVSQHKRTWGYLSGGKPGPISLVHLWLVAASPPKKKPKKPKP